MSTHPFPNTDIATLKGSICIRLANKYLDTIRLKHPMSDATANLLFDAITDQLLEYTTDQEMLELIGLEVTTSQDGVLT
jgi:hypothetical protein